MPTLGVFCSGENYRCAVLTFTPRTQACTTSIRNDNLSLSSVVMSTTWSEFLSRLLETSHKVDKAAVFSVVGQPLATTDNLQITESDGRALLHCLRDPARTLTRLTLDDTTYRCYQGNDAALVGTATGDPARVLVARLTEEALFLVMGSSAGHGSFLFELQQNILAEHGRRLVPLLTGQGQGPAQMGQGQLGWLHPPPAATTIRYESSAVQLQE